MVVLGETEIVLQQMVDLEQLVELQQFCFFDNRDDRDDRDDVYILSASLCVHLFHDVVFVQIKKRRRIIKLK